MPIELKSKRAEVDNIRQIRRYVDWIEQYYVPNRPSIIAPVLITHANPGYLPSDFTAAAKQFNTDKKGGLCEALRLIEFNINNGKLHYRERKI